MANMDVNIFAITTMVNIIVGVRMAIH